MSSRPILYSIIRRERVTKAFMCKTFAAAAAADDDGDYDDDAFHISACPRGKNC